MTSKPLTALLHTHNDGLRLGRCLETLYPCDEIVIVDYGSTDETLSVARTYGAKILRAGSSSRPEQAADDILPPAEAIERGWSFRLDPRESLSEALAASLFEWKTAAPDSAAQAFSVFLREETADGWIEISQAQTRLISAGYKVPVKSSSAPALEGKLLRFAFP